MINLILSLSIMFCDIKGEVNNPGVYEINNNNIYEIINIAGGLTKNAYISNINLSKKVNDEMVIYIPSKNDKPKNCPTCICPKIECNKESTTKPSITTSRVITTTKVNTTTNNLTTTTKLVININTASKEELISLNGVAEVVAENIMIYRASNPFSSIEEIKNVKGIGESVFAKIKDYITV